ncbi:hypothetical protein B0H13DRAFT_2270802, partial [Mycena leptocephala]
MIMNAAGLKASILANRSSIVHIAEIRVARARPTKLRVVLSVKTGLNHPPTRLCEAASKGAKYEFSVQVPSSLVMNDGKLLVFQVYQRHRWPRSDEQLLKEELSFEALLKHCSGQSESRGEIDIRIAWFFAVLLILHMLSVYEIRRLSDTIISAEMRAEPFGLSNAEDVDLTQNRTDNGDGQNDPTSLLLAAESDMEQDAENYSTFRPSGPGTSTSVVSNLSAALEIVQQVGKIVKSVPFLEPIGAILSQFVEVYKKTQDNYGKRDELVNKLAALARDISETILLLEKSNRGDDIGRFVSDLKEYADLLEDTRNIVMRFDDSGGFTRTIKLGEFGPELDLRSERLKFFGDRFTKKRVEDIQIAQGEHDKHLNQFRREVSVPPDSDAFGEN